MISALKLKNCILDVKGTACIKLTNARKSEGESSAMMNDIPQQVPHSTLASKGNIRVTANQLIY